MGGPFKLGEMKEGSMELCSLTRGVDPTEMAEKGQHSRWRSLGMEFLEHASGTGSNPVYL